MPVCEVSSSDVCDPVMRTLLRNGLVLMGVASTYQVLITGILVILAVSVDQLARRGAN